MKVLSLALVGLCGYAGSAMAACPDGPTTADGGAWTSATENGGTAAIAMGGYAGTECRLDSTINAGAGFLGAATVNYSQATVEPRFRAQFIIKADALSGLASSDNVKVFSAASVSGGAAVDFSIYGFAGAKTLDYTVRLADGTTQGDAVSLPAGETRVEFDLNTAGTSGGNDGYFRLWVNGNDENTRTSEKANLANNGKGVDRVSLGLSSPSHEYVSAFGGTAVGFDQFDSRRQTFIGF